MHKIYVYSKLDNNDNDDNRNVNSKLQRENNPLKLYKRYKRFCEYPWNTNPVNLFGTLVPYCNTELVKRFGYPYTNLFRKHVQLNCNDIKDNNDNEGNDDNGDNGDNGESQVKKWFETTISLTQLKFETLQIKDLHLKSFRHFALNQYDGRIVTINESGKSNLYYLCIFHCIGSFNYRLVHCESLLNILPASSIPHHSLHSIQIVRLRFIQSNLYILIHNQFGNQIHQISLTRENKNSVNNNNANKHIDYTSRFYCLTSKCVLQRPKVATKADQVIPDEKIQALDFAVIRNPPNCNVIAFLRNDYIDYYEFPPQWENASNLVFIPHQRLEYISVC